MSRYIFWQSVAVTVLAGPILILIRNKPPFTPSLVAFKDQQVKQRMLENFKTLFSNPNFILLTLSFSLTFAIYGAIAATVGTLAEKFEFDSDSVSIFGAVFVIFGVLGSVIHSIILD